MARAFWSKTSRRTRKTREGQVKKNIFEKSVRTALWGMAVLSMVTAHADTIDAEVKFVGVAFLDNEDAALATQLSIQDPLVLSVSGDFSPFISLGNEPLVLSPLILGAQPATLWTLGGFTFTPTAPLFGGGEADNSFKISAMGTIDDGPGGFEPTIATFSLTTSIVLPGGLAAFDVTTTSGNVEPQPVPDSANSLLLLALGMGALASARRASNS